MTTVIMRSLFIIILNNIFVTLKPKINGGGRLLILANSNTPASYFDPPPSFISFSNFGVASNVGSFFRTCEYSDCIKTQYFVLSHVSLFLDDVSTS